MSTFKGFSTPNYVQVPHEFFDIIMETDIEKSAKNRGISKSEIKLLAFMVRYTFGWQKAGFSLQFSFTDLQKHTNMQPQQINDAIKKCLEKGYIERKEINEVMYYRLKLDDDDLSWETSFDWKKRAPKIEKSDHYENHSTTTHYENHSETHYENHSEGTMKIIAVESASTVDTTESTKLLKKDLKKGLKKKDDDDKNLIVYEIAIECGMTSAKAKQAHKALVGQEIPADLIRDVFKRIVEEYGSTLRGVGAAQQYIKTAIDNELVQREKKAKQKAPSSAKSKTTAKKHTDNIPPLIREQLERQKQVRTATVEETSYEEDIKLIEKLLVETREKKVK